MRATSGPFVRWLAEKTIDGGVVDVDALVSELAVHDGEDRTGVDLHLAVVVEAPDTGDLEDDHPTVFLPDVDQRVRERLDLAEQP
jgi:hypothetical protein